MLNTLFTANIIATLLHRVYFPKSQGNSLRQGIELGKWSLMEMRYIIAASAGTALLAICIWLIVRNIRERRKFRLRQQGRGKNTAAAPAE